MKIETIYYFFIFIFYLSNNVFKIKLEKIREKTDKKLI